MISDLKEKESYHQQEIHQLNQTISDVTQQEIKYKTEIEILEKSMIELTEKKRSRNKLSKTLKLKLKIIHQMIWPPIRTGKSI